jgi:hypothetical protein
MDRFLAHILAFMAAILSKGIASGNDEDLNNITWFFSYKCSDWLFLYTYMDRLMHKLFITVRPLFNTIHTENVKIMFKKY